MTTTKSRKKVLIRAVKFKVFNPKTGRRETYLKDHEIADPWPELLKMVRLDKNHRTLIAVNK